MMKVKWYNLTEDEQKALVEVKNYHGIEVSLMWKLEALGLIKTEAGLSTLTTAGRLVLWDAPDDQFPVDESLAELAALRQQVTTLTSELEAAKSRATTLQKFVQSLFDCDYNIRDIHIKSVELDMWQERAGELLVELEGDQP